MPAARIKANREHRVSLCPRAPDILAEMEALRRGTFVFPRSRADKLLNDMALSAWLERVGVKATTQSFRSSFRDWVGDATSYPREVAEAALAHAVGIATEVAYRRSDALDKRRALMVAWANYVTAN